MSKHLHSKAQEYGARGYSVMPLQKDKKPVLSSWKDFQTTPADDVQIEKWWSTNDHNIGIITGKISGITVVDIDTGGDTVVPLSTFPPTYTVKTPTGGYHLYYKYTSHIKQGANAFPQFPHVDIRNDGGYVVAPPSVAEYKKGDEEIRGTYSILNNAPIAPFPTELFIIEKEEKKPSVSQVLKGFDKLADGDGRNVALTKIAGKILKLVAPKDYESIAYPMLLSSNKLFKKPLDEKEVRVIFNSIGSKERNKPLSEIEFIRTDKGVIIANVENVFRTLQGDPVLLGHFRLNTFAGLVETDFQKETWETFQREDVTRVRSYLMSEYAHFTKIPHGDVEDAMVRVGNMHKVSPPVEYMKDIVWDKKSRLDSWLSSAFGVEENVYHRAVGSNWVKGMVKRLVQPACKFDYVLVLEGKQGIGKSTALAILGGAWHVETVMDPSNKDFFMLFSSKAIVEFSEGETFSRTEVKRLKAVITMQYDKFRPPYERAAKEFPRQCVFAMTTNQEQYLKDETGNRRWLPVAIKQKVNTQWLKDNRDQLLAEAYHRVVVLEETVHEFPEEETLAQQSLRQTSDPRQEIISEWYYTVLNDEKREKGVTTRQAFVEAIKGGFNGSEMDRAEEMVIASILKDGLGLDKRRMMILGTRYYMFFPTPESESRKPTLEEKSVSLHTMDF